MAQLRSLLPFVVITGLIYVSRAVPHPPNLTLVTAAALWAFAFIRDRRLAWLAPVLGMFLADLYLGFKGTHFYLYTYGALIVIAELGRRFSPAGKAGARLAKNAFRFGAVTVSGSAMFFVLTNLGVFLIDQLYPVTWAGFIECYVMAIPFWTSQLVADVMFSAVFLLAYRLMGFAHVGASSAARD